MPIVSNRWQVASGCWRRAEGRGQGESKRAGEVRDTSSALQEGDMRVRLVASKDRGGCRWRSVVIVGGKEQRECQK